MFELSAEQVQANMLCAQLRHGASPFPLWYATDGQPCLCGKTASALADELAAGRVAAAADRVRSSRSRRQLQLARGEEMCSQERTRIGLLHAHLAVPGVASVLRPLVEPAAASVSSMAELLREFISIPSVRQAGRVLSVSACGSCGMKRS
eukprot:COSAG02_NODE_258_length_26815_cov_12.034998_6_plen_150_part_00